MLLSTLKGVLVRGGFIAFSVTAMHDRIAPVRQKTRRIPVSQTLRQPSIHETRRLVSRVQKLQSTKSAAPGELVLSTVRFSVPVQVEFGQSVKVVGNHPALGSWDTDNGVELEWNDGNVWEKLVHISPGIYEFKCVVVSSKGFSNWEPGPNRVIKIEEGQTYVNVGCKMWNTELNYINLLPDFAYEMEIRSKNGTTMSNNIQELEKPSSEKESKPLEMIAAGHSIPHVDKVERQGEDAFFVSTARNGVIGLADGVGSWIHDGIDPSMYPKGLMKEAKKAVEKSAKPFGARESMMIAQNKNTVMGSSTCILAMLENNVLDIANVGDSGLKILREGKIIFSTQVKEHEFNMPFQLTCMGYMRGDKALNADEYRFEARPGDVIVMASDGILDNLWDDALEKIVTEAIQDTQPNEFGAMTVANAITMAAFRNAQDPNFYSPWTDGATRAVGQTSMVDELVLEKTENPYMGGKMDDCTAVVAFITAQS